MMMMMKKMGRKVFSLLIVLFLVCHVVLKKCDAIWMTVPATGTKCVSEELQNNVVVLADYVVVSENDHSHLTPTIAAKVPPLIGFWFSGTYIHIIVSISNVSWIWCLMMKLLILFLIIFLLRLACLRLVWLMLIRYNI